MGYLSRILIPTLSQGAATNTPQCRPGVCFAFATPATAYAMPATASRRSSASSAVACAASTHAPLLPLRAAASVLPTATGWLTSARHECASPLAVALPWRAPRPSTSLGVESAHTLHLPALVQLLADLDTIAREALLRHLDHSRVLRILFRLRRGVVGFVQNARRRWQMRPRRPAT